MSIFFSITWDDSKSLFSILFYIMKKSLILLCFISFFSTGIFAQTILNNAHAHNDYYHDKPLLDALSQGFISVEADIFLVDGQLMVAHSRAEIKSENTFSKLYLQPLWERFQKNKGFIHPDYQEFTLLIDFKAQGKETYQTLIKKIAPFQKMLTYYQKGTKYPGAVSLIISGARPIEMIKSEPNKRWVGIDGRTEDLEKSIKAYNYPLISQNWNKLFKWRGKGEFPKEEKEKLDLLIQKTHQLGAKIRFWATPDKENVWQVLNEAGVDLVNIDNLEGYKNWYLKKE